MDRSNPDGPRRSSSPSSSDSHSPASPPAAPATSLDSASPHRAALPRVLVIHDPQPIENLDSAMASASTSSNARRQPPRTHHGQLTLTGQRHSQQYHQIEQQRRHEDGHNYEPEHNIAEQPQDRSHQAMYRTLRLTETLRRRAASQGRTSTRPELSFGVADMDESSSFAMTFDTFTYEEYYDDNDGIDLALPSSLDMDDDRDRGPRYDDDDPLRDWIPDPEPYSEIDDDADGAIFWPGLLIERPLNPPGPSLLRTSLTRSMLDRVSPCFPEARELWPGPTSAIDPDSSTSSSSFLQRGIVFSGIQVYVVPLPPPMSAASTATSRSERLSSHPRSHRQLAASTMDAYESARTLAEGVNLAFSNSNNARSTSLLPPARSSAQPAFTESSPLVQLLRSSNRLNDPADHSSTEDVFDPFPFVFSSSHETATIRTNEGVAELDLSPIARARLRTEQDVREIRERTARVARLRSTGTTGAWNQLREAEVSIPVSSREREKYLEHERWEVKVIIKSIDSSLNIITGYMHALNVPFSASRVTTYFTGEILDLARDGLWSPGHWDSKVRIDAESWSKLGPFKGISTNDLIRKADGDRQWLTQVTTGHVLMRWKERDFVNVTPAESHLSIAGFYFIVLDRGSGMLEGQPAHGKPVPSEPRLIFRQPLFKGLYHDPTSSPFQRLELSPWTQGPGFSTGTFDIA
ncbi:BQ2448_678 [Microbotryum intermedium]|uniref:BQ2448_678 protein n=1 Tax=Microbotryum intermedium TaxID=269621 RepID=A0A238F619_9BASI|nr:BQ2448_678 [Microbotryum intermedium]